MFLIEKYFFVTAAIRVHPIHFYSKPTECSTSLTPSRVCTLVSVGPVGCGSPAGTTLLQAQPTSPNSNRWDEWQATAAGWSMAVWHTQWGLCCRSPAGWAAAFCAVKAVTALPSSHILVPQVPLLIWKEQHFNSFWTCQYNKMLTHKLTRCCSRQLPHLSQCYSDWAWQCEKLQCQGSSLRDSWVLVCVSINKDTEDLHQ